MLPVVAVLGFMLKTIGNDFAGGGVIAAFAVVALVCVLGVAIMRMARNWDGNES